MPHWDVIVVGAGNAAFCAALAARDAGARVLVLERAPEEESGGNSRFTAGLIDVNSTQALAELRAYNTAVRTDIPFDPNSIDPGGTGLTNGAVFGRIAGTQAARSASGRPAD